MSIDNDTVSVEALAVLLVRDRHPSNADELLLDKDGAWRDAFRNEARRMLAALKLLGVKISCNDSTREKQLEPFILAAYTRPAVVVFNPLDPVAAAVRPEAPATGSET